MARLYPIQTNTKQLVTMEIFRPPDIPAIVMLKGYFRALENHSG
jgi:hypothetical protein